MIRKNEERRIDWERHVADPFGTRPETRYRQPHAGSWSCYTCAWWLRVKGCVYDIDHKISLTPFRQRRGTKAEGINAFTIGSTIGRSLRDEEAVPCVGRVAKSQAICLACPHVHCCRYASQDLSGE